MAAARRVGSCRIVSDRAALCGSRLQPFHQRP
ncbi:hypothetical protein EYF80_068238 [Liparis tanakae]|uniref:Uncharacterized protein n=1 Tax=Liparis tanakae TaxID=230148 RepID=A0A4Z2DZH6_9TELE|nr:hypothetical protein EYF80_068238 [Liparis tanakae]